MLFSDSRRNSGFTLIEMIVVVAIVLIMSAIVLGNLPAFRDKTSLDLVAQEVAITIRQAQVFGISTRVAGGSFPSHGIYFDSSVKDQFVLFADLAGGRTNAYDVGDGCGEITTECVELFKLTGGITIDGIKDNQNNSLLALNIIFQHPDPEAHFYGSTGNALPIDPSYVKIKIQDNKGNSKNIVVYRSGHIYVE